MIKLILLLQFVYLISAQFFSSPIQVSRSLSLEPQRRSRSLIRDFDSEAPDIWEAWTGILRLEFPTSVGNYTCAGSLIRPKIIVTAGTCLPVELRSSDTGPTNWMGNNLTLGTSFKAYAGDPDETYVGWMNMSYFVFSPSVPGFNLAVITLIRDEASIATLSHPLEYYEYFLSDIPLWTTSIIMGYGASTVSVSYAPVGGVNRVTIDGVGTLRTVGGIITSYTLQETTISVCNTRANGGELLVEDLGGSFNYGRMCIGYGDDGAPLFVNVASSSGGTEWRLAGVLVRSDDAEGCNGYTRWFTSMAFRKEWLDEVIALLLGIPYTPPICPSPTITILPEPTPTSTPTQTPSVTPTTSPIPEVIVVKVRKQWWWFLIIALFVFLVAACTCYWGCVWCRRVRKQPKVTPAMATIMAAPPEQISSQETQQSRSEYEVEREHRGNLSRGGEFVLPLRQTVLEEKPDTPQFLALKQARKARGEVEDELRAEDDPVFVSRHQRGWGSRGRGRKARKDPFRDYEAHPPSVFGDRFNYSLHEQDYRHQQELARSSQAAASNSSTGEEADPQKAPSLSNSQEEKPVAIHDT